MPFRCVLLGLLFWISGPSMVAAQAPFFLHDHDSVAFFGDSITQNGGYIEYVDAFLATRYPDREFRIINSGISSETISGTSEIDHDPRRPWAHERFERDIAAFDPDVVVSCFGMNDGNYHPFDQEKFEKYQVGIRGLWKRCQTEAKAQLFVLTPPPFDPYRRKVGDPEATHFGYKFPAVDYDDTLGRYSDWLLTLQNEGLPVADLHSAMNQHLSQRRKEKVSFHLAGDAVHPNPTGHWLMAQTLLRAWNVAPLVAEASIDAKASKGLRGQLTGLESDGQVVSFNWETPLPLPVDPRWDMASINLERVFENLSQYTLKVEGLHPGMYELRADGSSVGRFSDESLAAGIDVNRLAEFPTVKAAARVLGLVQKRRRHIYSAWRKAIAQPNSDVHTTAKATELAEEATKPTLKEIRQLSQPRVIRMELRPAAPAAR